MKTIVRVGTAVCAFTGLVGAVMAANEARVPRLLVPAEKEPEKKAPLRMSGLEIDVEVLGRLATTTLTMTFRNDLDRVLEGELIFPLGEGESVSRFAMSMADIDTMREGVVIEKARGRQIFESTVRKQIDPGLLEMTKGNNFRSRVYPIPAKGEKRIIVGYEGALRDAGDHLLYHLPLAFEEAIDAFKVELKVLGAGGEPDFVGGLLEGTRSELSGADYHATDARKDFRPMDALSAKIPKSRDKAQTFVHQIKGRNAATTYFHTTVPVAPASRPRPKPATICLLWDASGSAVERDGKAEIAALGAYLAKLGEVKVSLVPFRDRAGDAEEFTVVAGDWSKLRARLEAIQPDGGTRFGALDLNTLDGDEFVLVSDGLATFGQGQMRLGAKPVIALSSAAKADHAYLRSVARATGGQFVNLIGIGAAEAAAAMSGQQLAFLGFEGGGDRLQEVYPPAGAPVEGTGFSLAGIVKGDAAELTLKFGFGAEVTQRQKIVVDAADAARSPRAQRLWARAKIAELSLDYEANEAEVIATAKAHGIVTRGTSLIVLDSIDDYVQHRVVPPVEMQEEYFERIEAAELAQDQPLREHMEEVVARFDERKKWYSEKFPGVEAALVASAEFEVTRAQALVKSTGLRILKKRKLAAESLQPAEEMLAEAKALAEELDKLGDAADARAAWQAQADALKLRLAAFSADHDERYPEYARATLGEDGDADPFGGGGVAFFSGGAAATLTTEADPGAGDDPFAGPGDEGRALLRRAAVDVAGEPPTRQQPHVVGAPANGFPVTPAAPAADAGGFEPPEIPADFAGEGFSAGFDEAIITSGLRTRVQPNREGAGDGIALKKWDREVPYLKEMKRAKDSEEAYGVYLKVRRKNLDSSAFYLDVADHFVEIERKDLAVRALSNIAEMDLESAPLLRILGHRLLQIGESALAAAVFEEVLAIREEEPQSYRDLALAKMALGEHKRAAELLWEVVRKPWDSRFEAIDQIALIELNHLIAREGEALKPEGMDARLVAAMPVDLRVVLSWDADNTDIDLWVIDPAGEICMYNHNRTVTGGRMSQDYTQGYGPEEFVIHNALPGEYTIKADFYGNSQQTLAGATTIQAVITTNYGRSAEKTEAVTLRLRDEEDIVEVGKVTVGG